MPQPWQLIIQSWVPPGTSSKSRTSIMYAIAAARSAQSTKALFRSGMRQWGCILSVHCQKRREFYLSHKTFGKSCLRSMTHCSMHLWGVSSLCASKETQFISAGPRHSV